MRCRIFGASHHFKYPPSSSSASQIFLVLDLSFGKYFSIVKIQTLLNLFILVTNVYGRKDKDEFSLVLRDGTNNYDTAIPPYSQVNQPGQTFAPIGTRYVPTSMTMGYTKPTPPVSGHTIPAYQGPSYPNHYPSSVGYHTLSMPIYYPAGCGCEKSEPLQLFNPYQSTDSVSIYHTSTGIPYPPRSTASSITSRSYSPSAYEGSSTSSSATDSTLYATTSSALPVQSISSAPFGLQASPGSWLFSAMLGAISIIVGFHRLQF